MVTRRPGGRSGFGGVLAGLLKLARGRPEGLGCFNASVPGFLASLVPLLLLSLLLALRGGSDAASGLGAALVGLLAPPVLSHALAARWGREREWLRFAVAWNWCQWALPMLFALLLLGAQAAMAAGVGGQVAAGAVLLSLAAYALWLQWFITRHGLSVGGWRAAGLVLWVTLGTAALVVLPRLAAQAAGQGAAWGTGQGAG